MQQKSLTIGQVKTLLPLSYTTLRIYAEKGVLRATKIANRYYFDRDQIETLAGKFNATDADDRVSAEVRATKLLEDPTETDGQGANHDPKR